LTRNFIDDSQLFKQPGSDPTGTKRLESAVHDVKEAGQAFFKDAYEHPSTAALTVGGVALGAASLYAGRNQIARLLPKMGKDVLLVEDTPYMGMAFKSALETNGERVTWVTGFKRANPLTATTMEGKEIVLNPSKFKVAFVDGSLEGSRLQGEHVVDALNKSGLRTIGTSTVPEVNASMMLNGATLAAPKSTLIAALVDNKINLKLAGKAPATLQRSLDGLTEELHTPGGEALRKKAGQLLTKFMAEDPTL